MNNQIECYFNYLLDTETTSEIIFNENIQQANDLFQQRYLKEWEQVVFRKLQQVHRNAHLSALTNEDQSPSSTNETTEEEEDSALSLSDTDEETDSHNGHIRQQLDKSTDIYVDTVRQCQRLLRLLQNCQQHYPYFTELYFHTLEQCLKSDNAKVIAIVLQQIASHLFEHPADDADQQRLIKYLPANKSSVSIPALQQAIYQTIETLLSTNKTEGNRINLLANHIDVLYPYTARFLDARREFRDTTHYLIDGDSLLLSVLHHGNLNLTSYHGNTLHVIFIVERILLTLLKQAQQCNYTLVFFDCHSRLYQEENVVFSLLRASLIAHLSRNANNRIQQFSSWLTDDYLRFVANEKPMFLFYHDMSSFDMDNDPVLSKSTLEKLLCIYRLFGNYHQYVVQCQLYLMNKLTLTDTTVKCFQVQFTRMCPRKVLEEFLSTNPSDLSSDDPKEQTWSEGERLCQEIVDGDVRLFLYLKTLMNRNDDPNEQHLVSLLILHVALLIRLSLADRHLPASFPLVQFSPNFSRSISAFQQRLASNISTGSSSLSWSKIADLFDGRLFAFTLHQISSSTNLRLDSKTLEIVNHSLKILNVPSNEHLFEEIVKQLTQSEDVVFSAPSSEQQPAMTNLPKNRQQTIRISNPLIDTYLQPVISSNITNSIDLIEPDDSRIIQSHGYHHWTEYKDVGDEISRIRDNDASLNQAINPRYRTRNQQKLYDYFTLYGRSLTTRDVRDNQLQIILPTASTPAKEESSVERVSSASATATSGKKKQSHKNQVNKAQPTKAEKIIEQNKQRMMDKRTTDETDKVTQVEDRLKRMPMDSFVESIDLIDESLPSFETPSKRLELLKRKFDIQRKYLRSLKKKKTLTLEEQSKLELLQVGFFGTLCEMTHLENIADAFNEKKKFMEELVDDSPLDNEKWYRFQMEKINSRLPRREQGTRDDRVVDFIPDEWQVRFLNAVDKRQSIIIVAPTASGKTYASYYAMEKVLKDKDDTNGVCIYVAPTKALINQVAGTIHSKFGPIFGMFTPEYRTKMLTCRILVTVPECLEMLLLSPIHQRWCQRVRYCIFDEIHCMSGDIGSDVWERTMLLINCPMIGLSATVNNGKDLENWIRHVEQKRSDLFRTSQAREVCLITHYERLADLNKYLYSNRQLHPLHPVGLMNAKQLTTLGLPKDFSMSPCETLRLNEAMQKHDSTPAQNLTLSEHFSPAWVAERGACNEYFRRVCDQFGCLIGNHENSTIDSISSSLNPVTAGHIRYPEVKPMSVLIGEFVLTLKEKNLLPCIVFTDSRPLCEELAESVAQYFEELEKDLRRTKYKQQIEALERRLAVIEKSQKSAKAKKAVKTTSKRGDGDEEKPDDNPGELRQMAEEDQSQNRLSGYEQDLLEGVLEEGTLANRRSCDRELVDRLMEKAATVNSRLARYIKRGVAYHHPQLNNRGRLAVEGLFRNRYVQIVFSTWTLALGVHMPTKTVAFVKDSIQLDALQYRQSSGRAGRRGFDVQGNIVFLDIPLSKIRHLTISAIPNIQTYFPTNVTLLIRLLYFYTNAEDKKDAIHRSLIALQCPFNGHMPTVHRFVDTQIRFHCLHTLDFLYRLNLINEQGDLIGLAGILIHLHGYEQANLLFVYLMNTGLFHQLNDDEKIVNLLAYLFTNMPWLMVHQQAKRPKSTFNSKVSLQTISPDIRQRIQSYNSLVKEVYGSYIKNVIEQLRSFSNGQEYILPFSKVSFNQPCDYDDGTFEYHLHHHHSKQSHNPSISPFVGPSGLTHEQFMTNYNPNVGSYDLAYDLDLSTRIVPFVDVDARDQSNGSYYLNSYALDFFRHGSERLLMSENELDRGDTYHLLSDFLRSLTSIKTSLNTIVESEIKRPQRGDIEFFRPLNKKIADIQTNFSNKFYKEYK